MFLRCAFIVFQFVLFVTTACEEDNEHLPIQSPDELSARLATDWIDLQLYFVTKSPGFAPPVVARAFAYCGLAFYEALVPAMPSNKSLQGALNRLEAGTLPAPIEGLEYYFPLAANASAAEMSRLMFENAPTTDLPKTDSLEKVYVDLLKVGLKQDVIARSIQFGKDIATVLYSLSTADGGHRGFNRNFPASYVPPVGVGLWVPTNSQLALLPSWGSNQTFVKDIKSIVRVPTHPTFSTDQNSVFYFEAMKVYQVSKNLTDEQRAIAFFWNDDPLATFTPPGHSISIVNQLILHENKSLAFAAEAYARMGIALSDAFVVCWNVKYTSNLLRPVTYIQQHLDEFWNSLIIAPPFPEYTSGHSTQAAAAAVVLEHLFGANYSFIDKTHLKLNTGLGPRSFTSFNHMADECSVSRLYGGIHFEFGNQHGKQMGLSVGEAILKLPFKK
jgi:hypothetical protein